MSEKSHPLYLKPEETYRKIHLYPPRICESCAKTSYEVEWVEVSKTESDGLWVKPGTVFTTTTELKKLCKRCHTLETNYMYGGLF